MPRIGSIKLGSFVAVTVCTRNGWLRCDRVSFDERSYWAPGSAQMLIVFVRDSGEAACRPDGKRGVVSIHDARAPEGPCVQLPPGTYGPRCGTPGVGNARACPAGTSADRWIDEDDEVEVQTAANAQLTICKANASAGNPCSAIGPGRRERLRLGALAMLSVTPDCRPGPGEVALYEFSDFLGNCRVLRAGAFCGSVLAFNGRPYASLRAGTGIGARRCTGQGECSEVVQSASVAPETAMLELRLEPVQPDVRCGQGSALPAR